MSLGTKDTTSKILGLGSKSILGESLRNFVPDSKATFESFKKAFITCVAKTVLNIRSNPNDAKEKSWVKIHHPMPALGC